MSRLVLLGLLASIAVQCNGLSIERREVLADLDDGNLKKLDLEVRREILFLIVDQINKTTIQQSALSRSCEVKINGSIDSCKKCNGDLCTPETPPTYLAIAQALGAYAYSPVVATGEFVKSIGESLAPAAKVLGSGAKKFVDDLGGVSKTIGHGFKEGAESVFKGIASGFENLGDKFTDLGKTIGSGATDLLHGLGDGSKDLVNGLGGGLTDLSGKLGGALDHLGSGLTDLGSHLVDGVKNIGSSVSHAFGHIFGKRGNRIFDKRCTNSCPVCDKLDIKKHTKEQVLQSVCGTNTINSQKEAIQTVNFLRTLYNTTLTHNIVTKVQYDPTTIKTTGGISFASNYATFTINGKSVRFHSESDLKITDIGSTAKSLAHQIWAKL